MCPKCDKRGVNAVNPPAVRRWPTMFMIAVLSLTLLSNRNIDSLDFYERGKNSLEKGDYRSAIHFFRLATDKNPSLIRVHLAAARAYYEMGEFGEARSRYERVLSLDKRNFEALTGLGRVYTAMGEPGPALRYLKRVAREDPGNVENNFVIGEFYLHQGKPELARAFYQRVLRKSPIHVPSLLALARLAARQERYETAGKYLDRARRINPLLSSVRVAEADILFGKSLTMRDPLERTSAMDRAYSALLTARRIAPENVSIEKRLVVIDLYRRRFDVSLQRTEKLLETLPRNVELTYMAGLLQQHLKDHSSGRTSAVDYWRKALRLAPDDSLTRFALEEAVLRKKESYRPTGEIRAELADYHLRRARFYGSVNRPARANQHYRRALELNPGNMSAQTARMNFFRHTGDLEQYLDLLIAMRDARPDDYRLTYRLERALRESKKSLVYEERFFSRNGPTIGSGIKRSSTGVFVFDFRREQSQSPSLHPNAPQLLAAALQFQLEERGRIHLVGGAVRRHVLTEIRKNTASKDEYQPGVYYSPEFLPFLEEEEKRSGERAELIIGGFYRSDLGGLRVTVNIYRKRTGALLDRFELRANGIDAIYEIASRAVNRLEERISMRGRILRVRENVVFLNLGTIDGVKIGQRFLVSGSAAVLTEPAPYRGEATAGHMASTAGKKICRITVTARYVSRCVPDNTDWNLFNRGDIVFPISKADSR